MDVASPQRSLQKLPRGRHGLPRQFVVRSQHERMLDATSRAVSELGYPGLTVAAILERAGVSRKTFYEHFTDKEECFLAAFDAVSTGLLRGVGDAFRAEAEAGGDWPAQVEAALTEFLRMLAAEPDFARMCIVEVLAAGPVALRRRDGVMRAFQRFFDAPGDPALPPLVSESIVGAIYELVYARVLHDRTPDLPGLLPDLMFIALVPHVGRGEAVRAYRATGGGSRLEPR